MKRIAPAHLACTIGWILLVLAYFLFYYNEPFSILTPLVGGVLFLAAIPLLIVLVMAGAKSKQVSPIVVAGLVGALAIAGWFTPAGKTMGAYCKFWRNKASYEELVSKIQAEGENAKVSYPVTLDDGPPQRVAFSWGGMLDNWKGIVYDPTGEVMKANLLKGDWSNRDDPEYASVAYLFGGTMVGARHLQGPWYLCWFT